MKVIVTGASGMVGKGVLLECLEDDSISEVLSIGRRSLDIENPKLKELIHKDFSEFDSVSDDLKGYDACYACMGVSSAGMDKEKYTMLTYDYTMSLAKVLYKNNDQMVFIYVSGQGTDSSEKGRSMWARVKGKTENDLLAMGFRDAYMFRPGAIIPKKGVQPSSRIYSVLINNLAWLIKLFKKVAPNSIVDTIQVGRAMINATSKGYSKKIVHPIDMIKLSEMA
jgi:nucleoside-diphosphate-sugar epimerase